VHSSSALVGHLREKDGKTGNMMKIELTGAICKQALASILKIFALKSDSIETCWDHVCLHFLRMYNVRMELMNTLTRKTQRG
jgi:hypothetical protein